MKKIERKSKKYQHSLQKDGIITLETPTNILVVCNVGLVNGLSEEILLKSFEKYGEIADILMPPGKSYCFVSYRSPESANNCFTACNGKLNIAQDNKPIFLNFINRFPRIPDQKIWDKHPPGLIILENFITEDEENELITLPNFHLSQSGNMKHRQVNHYGYEFKYDINNVDINEPLPDKIPPQCNFMWPRLAEKCSKFSNFIPDQLTVNKYLPGQGIPSHIDTHSAFIDPIISLSLGSDIVMDFKNDAAHYCVTLPQRSLAIISGDSRYSWTHGITPRKYDVIHKNDRCDLLVRSTRISFTFRKLRIGECCCGLNNKCDSFMRKNGFCLEDNVARKLEEIHVHNVYENIAEHFSDTRHKPWPNILKFLESLENGSVLLDVGCGNGKYLGINKNIFNLGCDRSLGLVEVCKERGFQALNCDCLSIPLKDSIADACICIAVIHHLASEERRLKAIKEIVRILKIGGSALIYVWAKDQFSEQKKSNYIKTDKVQEVMNSESLKGTASIEGISLPIHTNRTQFKHKDVLVPWKLKKNAENKGTYLRFYHVYEEHELESQCQKLSNVEITSSYYDQGNWCVVIKKINDS